MDLKRLHVASMSVHSMLVQIERLIFVIVMFQMFIQTLQNAHRGFTNLYHIHAFTNTFYAPYLVDHIPNLSADSNMLILHTMELS